MSEGTILVVGSKLGAKGGGAILIGQFLNETAVPIMTLVTAGYRFVLATPTSKSHKWTKTLAHSLISEATMMPVSASGFLP